MEAVAKGSACQHPRRDLRQLLDSLSNFSHCIDQLPVDMET